MDRGEHRGGLLGAGRSTGSVGAHGSHAGNPFSLPLLNALELSGAPTLPVRPVAPFVPVQLCSTEQSCAPSVGLTRCGSCWPGMSV